MQDKLTGVQLKVAALSGNVSAGQMLKTGHHQIIVVEHLQTENHQTHLA